MNNIIMKSFELIKLLESYVSPVFSLADISKITGHKRSYVKVFLSRAVNSGLLVRVERNRYVLKDTNPLLVASNIVFPSYISFISALSYYNLTLQMPNVIYVVCLRRRRSIEYSGYLIKFVKFGNKVFFGYKREVLEGKFMFIAEVEKAILDSLRLPRYCPLSETFYAIKNAELDMDKLFDYARRMSSQVVIRRLGYLLELAGYDASGLVMKFKGYSLLNPQLPPVGRRDEKWKLIINEGLE